MINEILQKFINKYGKEQGIKKYRYDRSLESCILRYGEKEGIIKYNDWCKNVKKAINNIPLEKKKEINNKISKKNNGKKGKWHNSIDEFINKYGQEEGLKRYNNFRNNLKNNSLKGTSISKKMKYINSKQYYIDKYGEEEGLNKYNIWKKSQDHGSINFFINKYGQEKGTIKYIETNKTKFIKSYYSKISQECFNEISEFIENSNLILFGDKELQLYTTDNNIIKRFCYDFCYQNKIIEFNGDKWHCNPKFFKENDFNIKKIKAKDVWDYDKKKKELAESRGYEVLIIWEDDWKNNKIKTLNKVLNYLGIINKE